MRTEQKVFNDLIEAIVRNSENNIATITDVKLWAKCWQTEMEQELTLTDVVDCNCDESKQLEEEFEINHLINDTYQVVGKDSSTVWKQGTMEECNDWVML
jgi:hypothetical protein